MSGCLMVAAVEREGARTFSFVAADLEVAGASSDVRTFDSDLTIVEVFVDRPGVAHQ